MPRTVLYLGRRARTAVSYVKTLSGKPVVARGLGRRDAARIRRNMRDVKRFDTGTARGYSGEANSVATSIILLRAREKGHVLPTRADRYVRAGFRKSGAVRRRVAERARRKAPEVAESYLKAWLRSSGLVVRRGGERYAAETSSLYYKYVWKLGDRYVVQEPPWY
jgi:hypothetical protein